MEDEECKKLVKTAEDLIAKRELIKALVFTEDSILVHGENEGTSSRLHHEQATAFLHLQIKAENPDVKCAFLLAAIGCYWDAALYSPVCANALHGLASEIGSLHFYKKSMKKAKQGLSLPQTETSRMSSKEQSLWTDQNRGLERIIEDAKSKIASPSTIAGLTRVWEPKKSPETSKDESKGLRSYWLGLDAEIKRDLMKVSIAELRSYAEGVHKREGREALEKALAFAREHKKWRFWQCRTSCSKEMHSAEECKTHLEQEHGADFKPSSENDMVKRIGKDWARKISGGAWEPVDAVAAVEMITNQLEYVKEFTSKSKKRGWSEEWPVAADEKRRKLLNEIKSLLVLLCDRMILSSSIRAWLMDFPVQLLLKLGVSKDVFGSQLAETPQGICFLEYDELDQIQYFLKKIKCERDDGTDLVCRAVDSFWDRTRVQDTIDLDDEFSFVLPDKRLLKKKYVPLDDEGNINLIADPNAHYAEGKVQGDDIISWLVDDSSVDESFFSKPIREHNLDIWMAVLRAVQLTCRTLRSNYAKKKQFSAYEAALTEVENLCMSEWERRRDIPEDQWKSYASLLCDKCEERFNEKSPSSELFLCAVRDVFQGHPSQPIFNSDVNSLRLICERKDVNDDSVVNSTDVLKSAVTFKGLLTGSKILLIDNSRIRLLDNLTKLSVFDYRSYMLRLLKPFLLNEIGKMEYKAKSDAAKAKADILLEEEEKSQAQKKKKNKNKKVFEVAQQITSTSMSIPLDKTAEHDQSANRELEDAVKPEDTIASEMGGLEISSNTDIQDQPTEDDIQDMQNIPGEDPPAEPLEAAVGEAVARYNSALDMTLKALMNIKVLKDDVKQPFHAHPGEQVPSALQNFFTAFSSDMIKNDGVYSYLFRDLLASIEEVTPIDRLTSYADEAFEKILQLWQCWKNSERESLVNRLFTLNENESISCRKCRREQKSPEERFYGTLIAADSIRDLKCAFGDIKFVDILKVDRVDYKMLCDIEKGGCGKTNFVHRTISRCPPIFTIMLEWERTETEEEISETTKALELEIDISRLYQGFEPNTNYRLVSMVGSVEEKECICIAYQEDRWVNLKSDWESVVRFFGERNVRPEILFYEAVRSMA
ncbi:unnamed protein product [Microthlaspi erraticum]|uniref:C2H2-type domain-containing protein n=1 Tax=Microthlaspi erraticum TaxID=1685480 RepID=A0A6D2JDK2_9BRAS|nr:unnamed protein product [Microthlaspi erraticum]